MRKFLSLFTVMSLSAIISFGQQREVSGRVTDQNGNPVPGASVVIRGTNQGTSADANGNFRLTVPAGARLTISGVNMASQDVTVGSSNTVNVRLQTTAGELTNVVVTALGIRKKADAVGYATARVDQASITNGKSPNLASALSGKVSGLTINNTSSGVTQNPRIVLRGLRSLTGDNTALIVLDGVPVPANTINYINPNDVERVDVMKGGQAATLFGSDGVNGAIVITTKKGSQRPEFNVSTTLNTEEVAYLPRFQTLFGSGSAYGANMFENFNASENQQYGPRYDGVERSYGRVLSDGSVLHRPYSYLPSSRSDVWDRGFSRATDISFRSGGEQGSSMFMSYQNFSSKGVVPGDKYDRNTFRFNAGRTYNKLNVSFDANYSFDKQNVTNSDYYFFALNSASWIPQEQFKTFDGVGNPNNYYNDYYNNPYWQKDNVRFLSKSNNFQGNLKATYKIFKDLDLTARYALSSTNTNNNTQSNIFQFSSWARSKAFAFDYLYDLFEGDSYGAGRSDAGSDKAGRAGESYSNGTRQNFDLFGNLRHDFNNISVDLIVGGAAQIRQGKSFSTGTNALLFSDFYNLGNSYNGLYSGSNSQNTQRKISGYSDLTLGFDRTVYLHGTFRRDYSSLFSDASYGFTQPAFNYFGGDISIVLTRLLGLEGGRVIDALKIRGGYAKNGNDNLSPYDLRSIFPLSGGFPYNGLPGTTVGNTAVSKTLTPEYVKTAEVGLEVSMFKQRANLELSAYKQKSERQILNANIDPASGFPGYLLNAADLDNQGFEADLKMIPYRTTNSQLNLNFNFTYNDNTVNELYGDGGLTNLQYQSPDSRASLNATKGMMFPQLQVSVFNRDSASGKIIVDSAQDSQLHQRCFEVLRYP